MVNIEPIALVGWHAASRRVRLGEETVGFERSHVVANGGWRHRHPRQRSHMIRANGLPGCYIMLDYPPENGNSAVINTTRSHGRAYQTTEAGSGRWNNTGYLPLSNL
jgi:hypothetical protein